MSVIAKTELDKDKQAYSNFIDSLRSSKTKDDKAVKQFMKFHNIECYSLLLLLESCLVL